MLAPSKRTTEGFNDFLPPTHTQHIAFFGWPVPFGERASHRDKAIWIVVNCLDLLKPYAVQRMSNSRLGDAY